MTTGCLVHRFSRLNLIFLDSEGVFDQIQGFLPKQGRKWPRPGPGFQKTGEPRSGAPESTPPRGSPVWQGIHANYFRSRSSNTGGKRHRVVKMSPPDRELQGSKPVKQSCNANEENVVFGFVFRFVFSFVQKSQNLRFVRFFRFKSRFSSHFFTTYTCDTQSQE